MDDTLESRHHTHYAASTVDGSGRSSYGVQGQVGKLCHHHEAFLGTVSDLDHSLVEGVERQAERLRSFRTVNLEHLQQLMQLGVALEAGRYDSERVDSVKDAALKLGLPFTFNVHPQDNTLWLAYDGLGRAMPFGVRYGKNMLDDDQNQVVLVVALHPDREAERTDCGALTLATIMTLMYSGNGISAYESSRLHFNARTRNGRCNVEMSAPCEISESYHGKGLELRVQVPESRAR